MSFISWIASAPLQGLPQPPRSPLTGQREFRTQICSMMDLAAQSPLLAQIAADCRTQGIETTSALAEYGPGQFEVNLMHRADALLACEEALRFKRAVKGVARAHGCEATFLAKPYRDMAGSGLHIHVSLLDEAREESLRMRGADADCTAASCSGGSAGFSRR